MRQRFFCAAVWIRVSGRWGRRFANPKRCNESRSLGKPWASVRVDGMEMFNLSHEVMPQTTSLDGSAWCCRFSGARTSWEKLSGRRQSRALSLLVLACAWSLFDTLESSSSSRHVSNLLETKGGPSCQGRQEGMVPEGSYLQHGCSVRRVWWWPQAQTLR
ncbi:hypothetical protein F5883DRAFT_193688 [Diaporthe sp. PMI_573]|nr:hypothetical protein F5883DRAFT_193688 [Diaporthaceae sp. PMI_573]